MTGNLVGKTNWIEVSKNALVHNYLQVREYVKRSVKIMAVVKANGYGHGLLQASSIFAEQGADYLGVTTIEEGLAIRESGIITPILVFSPLLEDQIEAAILNRLDQTVCSLEQANLISTAAERINLVADVHVKIDTGMGRLGIYPEECMDFYTQLLSLPGIHIRGTYTHFADAGGKKPEKTIRQFGKLMNAITDLSAAGIDTGLVHAANSAALINYPRTHFDMVRPGTVLYGQYPSVHCKRIFDLHNTWRFKTRVVAVRKIRRNDSIGYGAEFVAKHDMLIAVIPVGYHDGFGVAPESISKKRYTLIRKLALFVKGRDDRAFVYINQKKAPVVGRISMQLVSIDVSDVGNVKPGDEVTVPMRRTSASDSISRIVI